MFLKLNLVDAAAHGDIHQGGGCLHRHARGDGQTGNQTSIAARDVGALNAGGIRINPAASSGKNRYSKGGQEIGRHHEYHVGVEPFVNVVVGAVQVFQAAGVIIGQRMARFVMAAHGVFAVVVNTKPKERGLFGPENGGIAVKCIGDCRKASPRIAGGVGGKFLHVGKGGQRGYSH